MSDIATKEYQHILVDQRGAVSVVTMNRPAKRNALSLAHMQELIAAFQALGREAGAAVVILRGSGPVFCSGHDLNELIGRDAAWYRQIFAVCTELMTTIQTVPQPVIAQVQGVATAAGCQLVASCDLAVAEEGARFATPGVRIGLFCSTPMVALTRAVGRKKALEMLLTGDALTAEEASAAGLINRVVPASELEAATWALAEQIAAASAVVVGIGKQAFYQQIDLPQTQAYAYTEPVMALNSLLPDAQEGMCAFLQKREPHWPSREPDNEPK